MNWYKALTQTVVLSGSKKPDNGERLRENELSTESPLGHYIAGHIILHLAGSEVMRIRLGQSRSI